VPSAAPQRAALMSAITRYVFAQVLIATLAITAALTFAVWLTQSLRLFDYIVNRGLPVSTFLSFIALLLPSLLGVVLPIATFTAVLFVYNKLAMDSEMVVLRAAGLSQWQIARPALLIALLVTLTGYALNLYLQPLSYRAFKDLQYSIRNNYSDVLLQEGEFTSISSDITVFVRERTPDGQLTGILVHDARDPKNPVTLMAENGALVQSSSGPRVVMKRGNRQQMDRKTGRLSVLYFDSYTVELALLERRLRERWREPKERFLDELLFPDDKNAIDVKNYNDLLAEGHQRLAAPLYSIAFVLVALVALLAGEFNRRGQMRRIVGAVLCVTALEAASFALRDIAARSLTALPLLYIVVGLVIAAALVALLRHHNRRPRAFKAETQSVGAS
jgi:lipopolysaccharide export system permease protein